MSSPVDQRFLFSRGAGLWKCLENSNLDRGATRPLDGARILYLAMVKAPVTLPQDQEWKAEITASTVPSTVHMKLLFVRIVESTVRTPCSIQFGTLVSNPTGETDQS